MQREKRRNTEQCNLKRSRRTVIFLPVYKISSLKITLPKTLQLKTLDFLQQMITMNENARNTEQYTSSRFFFQIKMKQ
jgi:hypothetical protein